MNCKSVSVGLAVLGLVTNLGSCSNHGPQTNPPAKTLNEGSVVEGVGQVSGSQSTTPAPSDTSVAPSPVPSNEVKTVQEGTLRLVIVSKDAPLRSMQKQLDAFSQGLNRAGTVTNQAATDAERAYLSGLRDSNPMASIPKLWDGTELVVMVECLDPLGNKKGKRTSLGYGTVAIVRPLDGKLLYRESHAAGLDNITSLVIALQASIR